MNNKKAKMCLLLAMVMASTPIISSVSSAKEQNFDARKIDLNISERLDNNYLSEKHPKEMLKEFGFSDSDAEKIFNSKTDSRIVVNGYIINPNGDGVVPYGKLSTLAKSIKAIWNRLPPRVKRIIGKYVGLKAFIEALDHFTGTVEEVIYKTFRYFGMPHYLAWWITKIITFLI